jgi:hypothetical protein
LRNYLEVHPKIKIVNTVKYLDWIKQRNKNVW